MDNAAIAFRIPFCNRRLAAADLKYNNGQNPLQFIVLDFLSAYHDTIPLASLTVHFQRLISSP